MIMNVYLDNSATTRAYDAVAEKMKDVMLNNYGNPSSLHNAGIDAEKLLKEARRTVASVFAAEDKEIIFTSGGTESDNMAIVGAYNARKRESNHIVTTTIEHPAVLETVKRLETLGAMVTYIDVDRDSRLDMEALRYAVSKGAAVISVMAVNNETGAMMPLCLVNDVKGNAILHCDAVQAFCKEKIDNLPADLISVSAHKIHGPKGIGALYIKNGIKLPAFIDGGGQERGLRSGTENLPGIVGMAEAVKTIMDDQECYKRIAHINAKLRRGLQEEVTDIRINSPENGAPYILNVSFLGTKGEVLLHKLEQEGIYVSTGSACSSGRNGKSGSHVLKAMGLSKEEIEGAIRFSFGAFNTEEEMDYVIDKVAKAVGEFRRLGRYQ